MENVVYLLGAGFSAPLGLPVMWDFYVRSKDIFASDPEKYAHFKQIFDTVESMHVAKSYYDTDLFNIEEILSVLEMQDTVAGTEHSKLFERYIRDVIVATTPGTLKPSFPTEGDGSWIIDRQGLDGALGPFASKSAAYCQFVANIIGLRLDILVSRTKGRKGRSLAFSGTGQRDVNYSIVTLNYDRVVEDCASYPRQHYESNPQRANLQPATPPIAKLHGSVDTAVVAPTWKKWAMPSLEEQWKIAYKCLSAATQLRILGYSLPGGDAYVRYLLRAAAMESRNLKKIDIVCLDSEDGRTKSRYEEFIDCKYARFADAGIEDYVIADPTSRTRLFRLTNNDDGQIAAEYTGLETHHEEFMQENS
ncbi:MAG: SIR2 family protein [Planctomycetota bacterium]|jgi:hypothetical protein